MILQSVTVAVISYFLYPLILLLKYRIFDLDDGTRGSWLLWAHCGLYSAVFLLPWILPFPVGMLVLSAGLLCSLYVWVMAVNPRDPPETFSLAGKVVLLTGGNRGVGFGTTVTFLRRRARVIITTRSPERGEQAVQQLLQRVPGAQVEHLTCDFSDPAAVDRLAEEVKARTDRLDVLLLNAGIGHRDMVPRLQEDGVDSIINVNLLAGARLLTRLTPLLEQAPEAVCVMTSSVVGRSFFTEFNDATQLLYQWEHLNQDTLVCYGGYGRSKALQILFMEHYAKEHPRVRAYSMHPGTVNTDMPTTIWGQLRNWYPVNIEWLMQPFFLFSLRWTWMNPEVAGRIPLNAVADSSLPSGGMLTAAPLSVYKGRLCADQEEHAKKIYQKTLSTFA